MENLASLREDSLALTLRTLKSRFHIVLPGEPLKLFRRNLCLLVTDSSFHFYHKVFPLLIKYNLKVVLAISTAYILDNTTCHSEMRLAVPRTLIMQEGIFETQLPFCTWQELKEMVESGHVEVAAHSHLHCNLTFSFVNLEREVIQPKKIIESKLSRPVTSFIYPFGRSTPQIHKLVREHYPFAFQQGHGHHWSWKNNRSPL